MSPRRLTAGRRRGRRLGRAVTALTALVALSTIASAATSSASGRWLIAAVSIAVAIGLAGAAHRARGDIRALDALATAAQAVQAAQAPPVAAADAGGRRTPEPLPTDVERALRDSMEATGDAEGAAREAVQQGTILALQMRSELARDLGDHPEGWTVAAGLRPAEGVVAGDCYDVDLLDPTTIGLVVLDIAGHGALSAVAAMRCRDLLKAGLRSGMAPGQAFGWLLAQDHGLAGTFLTGFIAVIDTETGVTRYASAGHPEALVRGGDEVVDLPPTGPIAGPVPGEWRTAEVVVPAGGTLVVYTDGLIEARDSDRRFYGLDRLRELVREVGGADAQPVVEHVLQDLDRFHAQRVADDVTLVVASRTAIPAASVDVTHGAIADGADRERGAR